MKLTAMACAALLLGGCATAPVSRNAAKDVPAERLFAFQQPTSADDGSLLLIRDSGMLGSGCRIVIYIDDVRAASFSTSEKATLNITAGRHILASGPTGNGLCGIGDGKESMKLSTAVDIKAQHTTVYRIAIGASGAGVAVMPVTL
ncbi:MAG: hypothetical protein ABI767_03535 [Rhodanobacter sp.]